MKVSSKLTGEIVKCFVTEGSRIKCGDTIAQIDCELQEIQIEQAKANVKSIRSQYEMMLKGGRYEDIKIAEENFNQSKINLENAELDFKKMKNLFEKYSITQKQFDDAKSRLDIVKSQYNLTKENLEKVKNVFRSEEISSTFAKVEQAEANVRLIQKQISDAIVISPMDGVVNQIPFEKNEFIQMGNIVVTISNLENFEILIYVSQTNLSKVFLNQKVEIVVDAFENEKFFGKIAYVSNEAQFGPKNVQTKEDRIKLVFPVKIKVENKNEKLKSGMTADIFIK